MPDAVRGRVERLGSRYGVGKGKQSVSHELSNAARIAPSTAILALLHSMESVMMAQADECGALRDLKGPLAHLLRGVGLPVAPP